MLAIFATSSARPRPRSRRAADPERAQIVGGIGKGRQRGPGRHHRRPDRGLHPSAVSGVAKGIQWLSNINMVFAITLALFVFVLGPTVFILNLVPTSIGSYLRSWR